jgi:hypothetical protein
MYAKPRAISKMVAYFLGLKIEKGCDFGDAMPLQE